MGIITWGILHSGAKTRGVKHSCSATAVFTSVNRFPELAKVLSFVGVSCSDSDNMLWIVGFLWRFFLASENYVQLWYLPKHGTLTWQPHNLWTIKAHSWNSLVQLLSTRYKVLCYQLTHTQMNADPHIILLCCSLCILLSDTNHYCKVTTLCDTIRIFILVASSQNQT